MCTAYELGKRGGSFPDHLNSEAIDLLIGIAESRLVRPTLTAPVILPDGSAREMRWGFRREFAAKVKGRGKETVSRTIVNSREDKLDGPTWNESFRERRCLIPVASYYEWVEVSGRKFPMRFERPDGAWLWSAGIWEQHPEHGFCFSMITTEPNARMYSVHDRMPALLGDARISPFLEGTLDGFGPSEVELTHEESANFLKPGKSAGESRTNAQGELF